MAASFCEARLDNKINLGSHILWHPLDQGPVHMCTLYLAERHVPFLANELPQPLLQFLSIKHRGGWLFHCACPPREMGVSSLAPMQERREAEMQPVLGAKLSPHTARWPSTTLNGYEHLKNIHTLLQIVVLSSSKTHS